MSTTTINGYELVGELSAQDAGFSRWGRCTKDGHTYFIKEFLTPVYPLNTDELPPSLVTRKKKLCYNFSSQKRAYYSALDFCRTGNTLVVQDFFRHGSKYYIVTDWIDKSVLGPENVAKLDDQRKLTFMRSLLYTIASLHSRNIVHADLKPDNLLLKHTKNGFITAKLIDFDAGFLVGNEPSELQGDFVYLAPEASLRMNGAPVPITTKLDIFALGLIIHQYWTGKLPQTGARYHYVFEAVLNDEPVMLDSSLQPEMQQFLQSMLAKNPDDRPDAVMAFHFFEEIGAVMGVSTSVKSGSSKREFTPPPHSTGHHDPSGGGGTRTGGFHVPDSLG